MTTSWPVKVEINSSLFWQSTLMTLRPAGAGLSESLRWMAVTSWPAAERALAIWDPRVPVA